MKPDMLTVARTLAPEDLAVGAYIVVMFVTRERMPYCFLDTEDPKPIRWLTPPKKPLPLRVVSVCVPFVLAEKPCGKCITLDIRRVRLALLSDQFGDESFKRLKASKTKSIDELIEEDLKLLDE